MVMERLDRLEKYVPACVRKNIMQWVGTVDRNIPDGIYEIAGKDVYARVLSYCTKSEEDCRIEAHDKYVDIQSTIVGAEGIQIYDRAQMREETPYDEEKDVSFMVKKGEPYARVNVAEACFVLLFPHEAHQPEISFDGKKMQIRKFVIKIREALYGQSICGNDTGQVGL